MPAAQFVQLDEPATEYSPALHEEQKVDETSANVPAGQKPVASERPSVAQNDPAAQAEHELEPTED